MKELNPLVEALNDIDSRYILEPKRRKRPIMLIAAAAAAACLSITSAVVVGAVGVIPEPKNGISIGDNTLIKQNFTMYDGFKIPDQSELSALNADVEDYPKFMLYYFDALPSDVFRLFNFAPLSCADFAEEKQKVSVLLNKDEFDGNKITTVVFDYAMISDGGESIEFAVWVSADENAKHSVGYEDIEFETITLNDGSEAVIHNNMGPQSYRVDFAYNGVCYSMCTHEGRGRALQILTDLGVL